VAVGALAIVLAELAGIGDDGIAAAARVEVGGAVAVAVAAAGLAALEAAARFIAEGGAASIPAAATACGVDCEEGSFGAPCGTGGGVATGFAADRATSEVSSGFVSCFHQAQRGPD
jgi:hypothetical protein